MIKLKVLGAGREVGRSAFLAKYNESNVLFDYGAKQTPGEMEYPLFPEEKVQNIVLSHAHLDHSGMIPTIFQKSNPYLYLTAPTLDLSNILWADTLKIAFYEGVEPRFDKEDIFKANKRSQLLSYGQDSKIAKEINIEMYDAGHILGSALTKTVFGGKSSILYTGDYNFNETKLQNPADIDIDDLDYVIVESTYGDRDHPPRAEIEADFVANVRETLENGGSVLIPAFAVGRAQEIANVLGTANLGDYPIYLDGMAQKVSLVYMKYPGFYRDPVELRDSLGKTIWIKDQKMRKKAVKQQSIIITTAGMLEGGPILFYIKQKFNDPKTSIFMTGFQVPQTKGHSLLEKGLIEIDGKVYKPLGKIKKFDFSAHIGKRDLLRTISHWNPKKVISVHGDALVIDSFVNEIKTELGIDAIGSNVGDILKLE